MICQEIPSALLNETPVLVVGAGPAGIVQALELRRHGVEVTMLAGGVDGFHADFQALADAEIADPTRHAPMEIAVRRALGGTSLLWGGRCVPFDDIDFADRSHVPLGGWPVSHDEIRPWYDSGMRYLNAGAPEFSAPVSSVAGLTECRIDRLERWSERRNLRDLHDAALTGDPGLKILLGAVAIEIEIDPVSGRAAGVTIAQPSGRRTTLRARAIVLACGGLETARLMLVSRMDQPRLFGGPEGMLGRAYMGHFEGRIADIVLSPALPDDTFDFFVDASGRYARRRITIESEAQQRHGLLNMCAWPDNPFLGDPAHRSAILSLAYLSLATPGLGHLLMPGFFVRNKARRYALFYHAEQAPNPASTVGLTDARDALGMPRSKIDLRYSALDAESVVAGHDIIDRNLRQAGLGRLEHHFPAEERAARVWDQMTDGYHQIGTVRMAADAKRGVVDADCRVHGTPNLFVAGSAVFPTSGQANPTLLIAAFSARLAAHIARLVHELPERGSQGCKRALPVSAVMPSFTSGTQTAPIEAAE